MSGIIFTPREMKFVKTAVNTFNNLNAEFWRNEELPPPFMTEDYAARRKAAQKLNKELGKK